jgi:hypothetical protein
MLANVENKAAALAFIKARRDLAVPSPRVKTNSEAGATWGLVKSPAVGISFPAEES